MCQPAAPIRDLLAGNSWRGIEAPLTGTPTVNKGSRQDGRLRGSPVIEVAPDAQLIARPRRKHRNRSMLGLRASRGFDGPGLRTTPHGYLDPLPSIQTVCRRTSCPGARPLRRSPVLIQSGYRHSPEKPARWPRIRRDLFRSCWRWESERLARRPGAPPATGPTNNSFEPDR